MIEDPDLFDVFLEIQHGLPRQGPGCDESTLRALSLCGELPAGVRVLDIGCGPGMQTVALARALDGTVTAVDLLPAYLRELERRATRDEVAFRIAALVADMRALPFAAESFDLLWCEGAAYIAGFETALAAWRSLLRPGGRLAVTELVWLRPHPPAPLVGFWNAEYPAVRDVETRLEALRAAGYDPLGHFTLPDTAWWEHYYAPLAAKLPALRARYAGDRSARALLDTTEREIELRRRFPDWYGYEFFVARRAGEATPRSRRGAEPTRPAGERSGADRSIRGHGH